MYKEQCASSAKDMSQRVRQEFTEGSLEEEEHLNLKDGWTLDKDIGGWMDGARIFFLKKKHECIKDDEHSMDEDRRGKKVSYWEKPWLTKVFE